MQSTLTQQRVRRDVEVLCGARLELSMLCCELDASLQRALPHVASVFAVIDPDMRLPTIAYKFGALEGHNASDADVAAWESAPEATHDATSLQALIAGGVRAITVSALGPAGSPRFQHLAPAFGFADELRVVAVGSGRVWGLLALFSDAAEFAADDVTFAASLAPTLGAGVRSGVLRGILNGVPARLRSPGFLTVDPEGRVLARNTAADAWLAEIDDVAPASGWTGMIAALAGRARASCGEATGEAACRVPIRNGGWAVARASVLHPTGEVLVALSEAGPRDIIPLIAEAFGLTPREREVVNLVLRGADTRRMGEALGLSNYTVQDHLRSVFDKAGVHSRGELLGKLFLEHGALDDPE